MQNWKQTAAQAIVTHAAPALNAAVTSSDAALAEALRCKLAANEIAVRDQTFATSLLSGFDRYQSFTDRQRPHVERLVAQSTTQSPPESPDKALGEALRAALPYVAPRDQSFATSLLSGFERYGSFTFKQRPYVEAIVARAQETAPAPSEPEKAPESPQVTRCPNICSKVNLNGFSRFTVGKLGLSLKNDGSVIWVKWDGAIAGSIDSQTTEYRATRRYLAQWALDKALEALLKVEADPLAAARENGVLTGRCSCCGRPLTDPTSISYGIGPICRERGFGVVL